MEKRTSPFEESVVPGETMNAQWEVTTTDESVADLSIDTLMASAGFVYNGNTEQTTEAIDVVSGQAGKTNTQLLVDFDGDFDSEGYIAATNEVINGQLDRKNGAEAISDGTLELSGGTSGVVFTPAEPLDDDTYLNRSVVAEARIRGEDAQEHLTTLMGITGNTWARYENERLAYGFTGPAATNYAEAKGTVESLSTTEFVTVAVVYTYVDDSTACVTFWIDGTLW